MQIRFFASIRGRLIILLTAVFAALFGALLLRAEALRQERDDAFSRTLNLARGFANSYDRLLGDNLVLIDTLLKLPGFDLRDTARCEETFRHVVAVNPPLANLVALDAAGGPRCAARKTDASDPAADAAVRRAIDSRGTVVGMSGEGQPWGGRAYVTLARPLLDGDGRIHAVILAYLDRDWLNARFAETVPAGVVLRILDGSGIFVVRQPNPECCVGKSGRQLVGIGEALASGREQVVESRWLDGVVRLQADLPLKAPLSGVVSIGVPEDVVRANASRGLARMTGLLATLCLLSYLIVWFFTDRFILRPVRALSDSARLMHEGNLGVRVPALPGKGEFAKLGEDFNKMAAMLEARQREIEGDLKRLAASEQALRESENRFRNLYEQAPLAHQSLAADGTILDVNAAWSELFGRPREEAVGRFIGDFLTETSGALLGERFSRFKQEGRTDGDVFEIVRSDGATRLVEVNGRIARDGEGNFLRTHCILSDVTRRRQAEAQLRLAASVFEQAKEAITITDAKGIIVAVNPRFTEITGYRADEAIGRNPRILQSGRQDAGFYRAMWDTLLDEGHWRGEIWNKRKDGTLYPEWLSISAVRNEAGKVTNYVAVFNDLTERKAAEEALQTSAIRLSTLIEAIPDAIFFKDGHSRWREINGTARRLFDLDEVPWQGKTDLELVLLNPAFSGEHMACWASDEQAWTNAGLTQSTEVIHQPGGGHRILDVAKVPLYDKAGGRQALVVIGRDVTEQWRNTEALERLNEELESRVAERTRALETANRELESFSYSVSHDLRAPLRAINGFSRLLEEEYAATLDDKARNYLSRVRAGSVKMGTLIDDLIGLSRVTRQAKKSERVDLSALAAEIAAELQEEATARKVEWTIAPGLSAMCDPGLIRVVLENLLGNALKYSSKREDARIEFGISDKDGRPAYFVRDNGVGFDMAYAGKLFGAFQRLHAAAEFPGTGIGLATVARVIHRHGGKVWAEGRLGEGATFWFTL